MNGLTAAERRRAILEALCLRRHDTRENLAFEFDVSKRTIEYDISRLSLEYPIYTMPGRSGGIFIMDGFHMDKPRLSDKQMDLLKRLLPKLSGEDRRIMQGMLEEYGKNNRRKSHAK